jgi:hypothetical protein
MEDFPVHEMVDVHEAETIFKTTQWWKAVLLYEGYGEMKIGVYLWQNTDDGWRRRQKFSVRSRENWERDKEPIETLLSKLELYHEEQPACMGKSNNTYHLLSNDETQSKCGTLDNKTPATGSVENTLTSTEARERGLTLCKQCANLETS